MVNGLEITRRHFGALVVASFPIVSVGAAPLIGTVSKSYVELCFSTWWEAECSPASTIYVHCGTTGWLTAPQAPTPQLHLIADYICRRDLPPDAQWYSVEELNNSPHQNLTCSNPLVILTLDLDDGKDGLLLAIEVIEFFKLRNALRVAAVVSSYPNSICNHMQKIRTLQNVLRKEFVEVVVPTNQCIEDAIKWDEGQCVASYTIAEHITQRDLHAFFDTRWRDFKKMRR